ncbi:MAG: four helix bundle protein [Saprospiraceae bacterium]|nr:four helix bundle protein [Saprospiraceae bacterium]
MHHQTQTEVFRQYQTTSNGAPAPSNNIKQLQTARQRHLTISNNIKQHQTARQRHSNHIKRFIMTLEKFEDLVIWRLGRDLSREIYETTKAEIWREDFDFRNQIRRSAGSVPDNIAEGFEREGNNEFINFLSIAKGSCGECRCQIYRAFDRQYIDKEKMEYFLQKTIILSVKIHNTIQAVKQSGMKGNKFKR